MVKINFEFSLRSGKCITLTLKTHLSVFFSDLTQVKNKQVNWILSWAVNERLPWFQGLSEALFLSLGALGKWTPFYVSNLSFNYSLHYLQDLIIYPRRAFDLKPYLLCVSKCIKATKTLLLIAILAYLKFCCLNAQLFFLTS